MYAYLVQVQVLVLKLTPPVRQRKWSARRSFFVQGMHTRTRVLVLRVDLLFMYGTRVQGQQ